MTIKEFFHSVLDGLLGFFFLLMCLSVPAVLYYLLIEDADASDPVVVVIDEPRDLPAPSFSLDSTLNLISKSVSLTCSADISRCNKHERLYILETLHSGLVFFDFTPAEYCMTLERWGWTDEADFESTCHE